jgi:hypothetical protein
VFRATERVSCELQTIAFRELMSSHVFEKKMWARTVER